MKRLTLTLAIVASFLIVAPGPPAEAHGACSVTSVLSLQQVVGGVVPRMNASTFCSDVHVSTTIEIFLHQNGRSGPVVFFSSNACTNCRAVEIQAFYGGPCSNGEKYVLQAFGFQRQDRHNQKQKWSSAIKCPITV